MWEMKKGLSTEHQSSPYDSTLKLFVIETLGSSYDLGMVFTVLAENQTHAEDLVLEWIKNYGDDHDEIDTIRAVVSRDVRAIINVGKKIFTS